MSAVARTLRIMPNRAERRAASRGSEGRDYHPPRDLAFNEFVGELGPPNNRAHTELHVRYGERDGLYLDWSISLSVRLGNVDDFREARELLERRELERVDVSRSAIRHQVFDPDHPGRQPRAEVILPLRAGDQLAVDAQYDIQMRALSRSWANKHGAGPADPHTKVTFGFASKNRDPDFRHGTYSWVRNTLIALDVDEAEEVIVDRGGTYFRDRPSTAGVLLPDGVMRFIKVEPGTPQSGQAPSSARPDDEGGANGPIRATGTVTMGMLVDSIYSGNWTDYVDTILG